MKSLTPVTKKKFVSKFNTSFITLNDAAELAENIELALEEGQLKAYGYHYAPGGAQIPAPRKPKRILIKRLCWAEGDPNFSLSSLRVEYDKDDGVDDYDEYTDVVIKKADFEAYLKPSDETIEVQLNQIVSERPFRKPMLLMLLRIMLRYYLENKNIFPPNSVLWKQLRSLKLINGELSDDEKLVDTTGDVLTKKNFGQRVSEFKELINNSTS